MEAASHEPPPPGVLPHVATAAIWLADGTRLPSFSRGIGRNRVAIVSPHALPIGLLVRFEITIEGGLLSGDGRISELRSEPEPEVGEELWAVIDVERLDQGSAPRLLRALFRERYLEYRAANPLDRLPRPLSVDETRRLQTASTPPWRRPEPEPEDRPQPASRPKVSRWSAPEAPDRFKRRAP